MPQSFFFFHVFGQKVLMSEFCFAFSFNYCHCWSWVVGTANIKFCFNHAKKTPTQYQPQFILGASTISLKFWKGDIAEFKGLLPHIFVWGFYHAPWLCNIKYGFQDSISNVDMACFSQTTN